MLERESEGKLMRVAVKKGGRWPGRVAPGEDFTFMELSEKFHIPGSSRCSVRSC